MEPKIFIGPMSKNVVDVVCELNKEFPIALIPSRRQIEWDGGYVNNWDTLNFRNYVKSKNPNVILCRDHAGPGQGKLQDDGYESLRNDCMTMDIIHIDPFKDSEIMDEALRKTILLIKHCHTMNPVLKYEVGTEEAIFKYQPDDLFHFLNQLQDQLTPEQFGQIAYAVVQSGTGLDLPGGKNTGTFDADRLKKFVEVVKSFNLKSKEHNGDFLTQDDGIKKRFELGLDAINIAPEFGYLETGVYMDKIVKTSRFEWAEDFGEIVDLVDNWKKWMSGKVKLSKKLRAGGHYVFSLPEFKQFKKRFPNIDIVIKETLKQRLYEIHKQAENSSV